MSAITTFMYLHYSTLIINQIFHDGSFVMKDNKSYLDVLHGFATYNLIRKPFQMIPWHILGGGVLYLDQIMMVEERKSRLSLGGF